jgi:hypothetical protein
MVIAFGARVARLLRVVVRLFVRVEVLGMSLSLVGS